MFTTSYSPQLFSPKLVEQAQQARRIAEEQKKYSSLFNRGIGDVTNWVSPLPQVANMQSEILTQRIRSTITASLGLNGVDIAGEIESLKRLREKRYLFAPYIQKAREAAESLRKIKNFFISHQHIQALALGLPTQKAQGTLSTRVADMWTEATELSRRVTASINRIAGNLPLNTLSDQLQNRFHQARKFFTQTFVTKLHSYFEKRGFKRLLKSPLKWVRLLWLKITKDEKRAKNQYKPKPTPVTRIRQWIIPQATDCQRLTVKPIAPLRP